jgi:hypothetical protein
MSRYNVTRVFLMIGLMFFVIGCTTPDNASSKNRESMDKNKPAVGGVAIGLSPKIIYADKGGNVSFAVDLLSTENADDRVTININGTWINRTFLQDIKAGEEASVPVSITVPLNAGNTTLTVKAVSHNLNATSSTTGMIIIGK